MIALYLLAIVGANLIVTRFGPAASIFTAFIFIGLDLTSRDKLHDRWRNNGLVWKMMLLVGVGSILSYLLNSASARIAIASFVAFSVAAVVDTTVYHFLHGRPRWQRINGSNVPSALADSVIFPTLAFGTFLPLVILGQFAAKVFGGAVWSMIFEAIQWRRYTKSQSN